MINIDNKGIFKEQRINRQFWDYLFIYDEEINKGKELEEELQCKKVQEQLNQMLENKGKKEINSEVYQKYLMNILTHQEMKENLYPDLNLYLYKNYHTIPSNKQQNINTENIQQQSQKHQKQQINNIIKNYSNKNLILVIDCQMVTTQIGFQLARCTIINYQQQIIFDEFFKPLNKIINYNTQFSGITQQILFNATNTIQNKLHTFLSQNVTKETILIGHSLENDFNAMKFFHDKVVDTSVLFRRKNGGKIKLKHLAEKILKRKIQHLTHDSKEDCLATLHLVQLKVQSQNFMKDIYITKQYHLLRDLVTHKKSVLIVDHDIDKFRPYTSFHFQKTLPFQTPSKLTSILSKYSNSSQVSVPKLLLTRFQKPNQKQWEQYYLQIDSSIRALYQKVPDGSVLLLNHQVNQGVRVMGFEKQKQGEKIKTRPFLVVLTKSA